MDGRKNRERKIETTREQTLPLDFSKGEQRFVWSYAPAIAFDKRRDEPIQRTRVHLPSVDLISNPFSFPSCTRRVKEKKVKMENR